MKPIDDKSTAPSLTLDEIAWIKTESLLRINDHDWQHRIFMAVRDILVDEGLLPRSIPTVATKGMSSLLGQCGPGQATRVLRAAYLRAKAEVGEKPWTYVPPTGKP